MQDTPLHRTDWELDLKEDKFNFSDSMYDIFQFLSYYFVRLAIPVGLTFGLDLSPDGVQDHLPPFFLQLSPVI